MRVAITVDEGQTQHPYVEALEREQESLGRDLARGVRVGRRAGLVFANQAASRGAVDQASAREDEALDRGVSGGVGETLRAEVVDLVRLLSRGAAKEGRAVDHRVDALHRPRQRVGLQEVTLHELDAMRPERSGTCQVADQSTHLTAPLNEPSRESTSDLACRTGYENLHAQNLSIARRPGLEESDQLAPDVSGHQTPPVLASALLSDRVLPSMATASAVAALSLHECAHDVPLVAIPRPEISLVVRFGPSARNGLDMHAMGVRERAHRKLVPGGLRTVVARLQLGAHEAVLGAAASEIAGRVVALEGLWGERATGQLADRIARASTPADAAAVLDSAIAGRLAVADVRSDRVQLALDAARGLTSASVTAVAAKLGVSERHLRRVFRETLGLGPKTYAKLARFHRALRAAQDDTRATWASIAVAAGYYDQAHLNAEFRTIAGATPRALLGELRAAPSVVEA